MDEPFKAPQGNLGFLTIPWGLTSFCLDLHRFKQPLPLGMTILDPQDLEQLQNPSMEPINEI